MRSRLAAPEERKTIDVTGLLFRKLKEGLEAPFLLCVYRSMIVYDGGRRSNYTDLTKK